MPWFDGADSTMPLRDSANVGAPGSNGTVRRIVVHTCGNPNKRFTKAGENQALSAWNTWTSASERARMGVGKVSAHFVIEFDGRIVQFASTDDAAYGTGWLTTGSVHIEFAGNATALTGEQLHYGAMLCGWIREKHPEVDLSPTGTSESDPGDPTAAGITCHKFIQVVWRRDPANAKKKFTPKNCPGTDAIDQLPFLSLLARGYAAFL